MPRNEADAVRSARLQGKICMHLKLEPQQEKAKKIMFSNIRHGKGNDS